MDILSSIKSIKGIGEKTQTYFAKLGIETVEELIEYYPREYDVFEAPVSAEAVKEGKVVAVYVTIRSLPTVVRMGRKVITGLDISGHGDGLAAVWYNMPYLASTLKPGNRIVLRGKPVVKRGRLTFDHPAVFSCDDYMSKLHTMQPIYGLTEGLTNKMLTKSVKQALSEAQLKEEYLPIEVRETFGLCEYNYAVTKIHFPADKKELYMARRRLVFDEFYLFTLALAQMREHKSKIENAYCIEDTTVCDEFIQSLPYPLTSAQKKVWKEIRGDLQGRFVMNRLIQGDVGSGKTVIAQIALLAVVHQGYQGCLMAPTEVLARQHYESFLESFDALGIRTLLLTGSMTAKEKRLAYEQIKNHEADIVIGTHALIQEKVVYHQLALVITDEQHRFGVHQREFLSDKGIEPHVLVMSATPIPRTLAIILYGDLDISVIDELPAKRLPIKNCVVDTSYRGKAYQFIQKEVRAGHQVYVICPMVEESETMEGENVLDYTKRLEEVLPMDIKTAYLHGKMKPREKNEIMEAFSNGEISVLVSTTVVEVGVNVPNATVMMVENSERFGLAQLHQLRGRVGRGSAQSYCIFVSGSNSQVAKERLEILVKSNDGFFIASEDLKLRGPGDLFGLKQSGLMEFKIADIFQDVDLLKAANETAMQTLSKDPLLVSKEHQALKRKIEKYMTGSGRDIVL